jgi:hypothetical protein
VRRFDYIKYDKAAQAKQADAKSMCENLEKFILTLPGGRAQSLAITKLEEVYMWIGKAIRDDQLARDFIAQKFTERQEERNNS